LCSRHQLAAAQRPAKAMHGQTTMGRGRQRIHKLIITYMTQPFLHALAIGTNVHQQQLSQNQSHPAPHLPSAQRHIADLCGPKDRHPKLSCCSHSNKPPTLSSPCCSPHLPAVQTDYLHCRHIKAEVHQCHKKWCCTPQTSAIVDIHINLTPLDQFSGSHTHMSCSSHNVGS
jgi:hypothetical protein